ncbi:MAG: hypothetical protein ACO1Q7_15595 [Gemmatimonas sp.]
MTTSRIIIATSSAAASITMLILVAALLVILTLAPSSSAAAQSARWSVDAKPRIAIGSGADGGAEFAFVNGVTRLPDGNYMVSDRNDYSMLIVSPKGAVLRKFGRAGSGPGELRDPFFSWRCGNHVFVSNGNASMHVFALDGSFVRTYRQGTGIAKRGPYRSACNSAGQFVHYGWDDAKDLKAGASYRSMVPVWIAPGDSSSGRLIVMAKGSERWNHTIRALGRETRIALGRERVYVGEADRYEIRMFSLDGIARGSIQKAVKPAAVTKQDVDDDKERLAAMMGPKRKALIDKDYESMSIPTELPPYREFVVDSDDNLWVRDYARSGANVTWTVFSPTGKQSAEVSLPNALEVHEIGRDYVLGRYLDPVLGVPEVREYRLVRR